ncbi:hypothetical protein PPEP_a2913 [Pseudoalteromonas peptidolytica F12-50-A1]|uniref:Uncharacterized protein n=1 Tax=Pseudoalteromonas peptidolytica F12-50-A1 TaxID=1315280 RepID=A0A8I0MVT3_9GAMM|nr:hypothetical protein [Pseudoalteromonas peptidolytica F12-50-A1]
MLSWACTFVAPIAKAAIQNMYLNVSGSRLTEASRAHLLSPSAFK